MGMNLEEEYTSRVLKVLVYIEDHVDEEMTLGELASIACYSPFHFHRLFQVIVGESLHKYIRRLKLEKAAGKLRYSSQSVTEIALDACYDTPSAFTKAFKQWSGFAPERYRLIHTTIQKEIKELSMIKPDVIEKNLPDLKVLFIRRCGSYERSPAEAWIAMKKFMHDQGIEQSKIRSFGISHDDPNVTMENHLRYDAAILSPGTNEQGEVGRQTLKGGKYAVFSHFGPYESLKTTFDQIFLKWLPTSRESFDENRSVFTEYFNCEFIQTNPEKLITKIYIPLM